jgi:hypothetical protein
VFVPKTFFQHSLMLVGKAVVYLNEAPFRCSALE